MKEKDRERQRDRGRERGWWVKRKGEKGCLNRFHAGIKKAKMQNFCVRVVSCDFSSLNLSNMEISPIKYNY